MQRARTFTLIATCAVATVALTGCGNGADAQYANDGVLASSAAGGSIADQVSGSDSIFGSGYDIGSGVANDTSINGTIPASYGTVPGASSLNPTGSLLTANDSITNSSAFDSIALSDPTASTGMFDASSAGLDDSATIDGLVNATDTNFDSAIANAQDAYSAASSPVDAGLDPSLDPSFADDTAGAGLGADSMPDF